MKKAQGVMSALKGIEPLTRNHSKAICHHLIPGWDQQITDWKEPMLLQSVMAASVGPNRVSVSESIGA